MVSVGELVMDGSGVWVGVGVAVRVTVGEGEGVAVFVGEGEGVGVGRNTGMVQADRLTTRRINVKIERSARRGKMNISGKSQPNCSTRLPKPPNEGVSGGCIIG